MADPADGGPERTALPPEEAAARRRRLVVIVVMAVLIVGGWQVGRAWANRTADRAADDLRARLERLAVGVTPADVVMAAVSAELVPEGGGAVTTDADAGPGDEQADEQAAALVTLPEYRTFDQPSAEEARLVFRPHGWQAVFADRCVVLVVRPTDHVISVRGHNCGLEPPTEG